MLAHRNYRSTIGNDSTMSGCKFVVSAVDNGTMKFSGSHDNEVLESRRLFLQANGFDSDRTVVVQLDYNTNSFCTYRVVDDQSISRGTTMPAFAADGLATKTKKLGLFLPLADCNGVVLHDPVTESLMLTHLGRHNLEQRGGFFSVKFMQQQFGTNPTDLRAYFSPYAGGAHYPLYAFDNKSIGEVSADQLSEAGVLRRNIRDHQIDTTTDQNYFSHSQYKKGRRPTDGRFAIAAMLTD